MEEWFLNEFGYYGFTLSQTMYDPHTFTPIKRVIHPDGHFTTMNLVPELANDLQGWGITHESQVEDYREIFRHSLYTLYPGLFKPKDFRPTEKISKLNFI